MTLPSTLLAAALALLPAFAGGDDTHSKKLTDALPTLQKHEDMANDILNKAGKTASTR